MWFHLSVHKSAPVTFNISKLSNNSRTVRVGDNGGVGDNETVAAAILSSAAEDAQAFIN